MAFPYNMYLGYISTWARTTMCTTTIGSFGYCSTWVTNLEPQSTTTLGAWVTVELGLEIWGTTMSPVCNITTYTMSSLYQSFPPSLPGCGSTIFNAESEYIIILGAKICTQKNTKSNPFALFLSKIFFVPNFIYLWLKISLIKIHYIFASKSSFLGGLKSGYDAN